MPYIGKPGEVVLTRCEDCNKDFYYRADGIIQPCTCQDCFPVNGVEYVTEWNIVLTNDDGKDFVIPLGVSLEEAHEIAAQCCKEIEKGVALAYGWREAWPIWVGWPEGTPAQVAADRYTWEDITEDLS